MKTGSEAPAGDETAKVRERYARRGDTAADPRYSMLNPATWQTLHERQRAVFALFQRLGFSNLAELKLLEVGCGSGGNLLEFLRMGFRPENLTGLELLEDRIAQANSVLPAGIVQGGDANEAIVDIGSQDIVFQSVVFSSLLDESFEEELAARMWSWVKPGGGVLWYDFVYDNPANPDVRGVSRARVRELFSESEISMQKITLAPPISRFVTRLHPALYSVFNMVPLLRTHLLCWLAKSPQNTPVGKNRK